MNEQPVQVIPQQQDNAAKKKKLIIQGILLFVSPAILFVVLLVLTTLSNLFFSGADIDGANPVRSLVNIVLFLAIAVMGVMMIVGPILGIMRLVRALRLP